MVWVTWMDDGTGRERGQVALGSVSPALGAADSVVARGRSLLM